MLVGGLLLPMGKYIKTFGYVKILSNWAKCRRKLKKKGEGARLPWAITLQMALSWGVEVGRHLAVEI